MTASVHRRIQDLVLQMTKIKLFVTSFLEDLRILHYRNMFKVTIVTQEPEAYLGTYETSMMKFFVNIVNSFRLINIFKKVFIMGVRY